MDVRERKALREVFGMDLILRICMFHVAKAWGNNLGVKLNAGDALVRKALKVYIRGMLEVYVDCCWRPR
jgi:hypothetical protein